MDNEQKAMSQEKPTIGQLWQDIKKHKRLYYKVLSITFIVSAILLIGTPNYYRCTVKLAPELSGSKNTSSLASIANSFGLNIGSGSMGSEALFPTLYPDLMNSVAFRTSLFSIKVKPEDSDTAMTYYAYLNEGQKKSLLEYTLIPLQWVKESIASLFFSNEKEEIDKVDPFKLTKEQFEIVELMEKKVVCDVDNKTLVITIDVIDQDPLIAANMADSVQLHLQEFITNYRTRKARIDLAYNQKLFKEAQERYEKARLKSAAYSDANRHAIFAEKQSEITKLENEMNLQYQAYSQVAAQLQMAEAKVQEETPAFTTLQPASVPMKKAGPRRFLGCLFVLFLTFIFTSLYVINLEGNLKWIIYKVKEKEKNEGGQDSDEEYYVLTKYSH